MVHLDEEDQDVGVVQIDRPPVPFVEASLVGVDERGIQCGAPRGDGAEFRAVAAFLDFYPAAQREHRYVEPAEIGAESIGHFGYFRESLGQRLWPGEVDWLCDEAAS